MSVRVQNINTDIIEWAIIRSGNDPEAFYAKYPTIQKWVGGENYPTVKQLEYFTHKVHVPFGYMFLPSPPQEDVPIPFFRTNGEAADKISLNVFHTIQIHQERQDWLTEYLEEIEFPDLNFVGKYNLDDDYRDVVNDIREVLALEPGWTSKTDNWEQALNFLTSKIENAGIIVTFNGVVGNNTKRPLNVDECRGFVLVNKKALFLFVNNADAKAAQMFTIMHELAHVWLGESAGFDNENLLPAHVPLEIMCDKIAAELLVSEEEFLVRWETTKNFQHLSRVFKVSQIVIARRALDLALINREQFFAFYHDYMNIIALRSQARKPGGDFYATAKKRISLRFASFVRNAVKENKLLYRDAYKLTNLKGETYNKFINEHLLLNHC